MYSPKELAGFTNVPAEGFLSYIPEFPKHSRSGLACTDIYVALILYASSVINYSLNHFILKENHIFVTSSCVLEKNQHFNQN